MLVMMLEIIGDSSDEFGNTMKDAPTNAILGQVAEEAFHYIQPGGAGGCEMHVETGMAI